MEKLNCGELIEANYSVTFHIGALCAVLFCSMFGAGLPLMGRILPCLNIPPFVITVCKCMGTGVVLAVPLIHMLPESDDSLRNPCMPQGFLDAYRGTAYLLTMVAAILMHAMEMFMETVMASTGGHDHAPAHAHPTDDTPETKKHNTDDEAEEISGDWSTSPHGPEEAGRVSLPLEASHGVTVAATMQESVVVPVEAHDIIGHSHMASPSTATGKSIVVSAIMMECGISLHSVFVGLTAGVTSNEELITLLVALLFHQMFEGIALGSSIVRAKFSNLVNGMLILIFGISVPLGMIIAIALMSGSGISTSSLSYLYLQGITGALGTGLLLYLGFGLLLNDFPADYRKYCMPRHGEVSHYLGLKRFAMFAALWLGAGLMAYVGKFV